MIESNPIGLWARFHNEFQALLRIEKTLGYEFQSKSLIFEALTHSSALQSYSSLKLKSYERLEFLGDAVLGFTIGYVLYAHPSQFSEGNLTKHRAGLVCESYLANLARQLDLGDAIILGPGEAKNGRDRDGLLADTLEALIATIFLESGLEKTSEVVKKLYGDSLFNVESARDYKSDLQKYVQGQGKGTPSYRLVGSEGPDHNRVFVVEVIVDGNVIAQDSGKSKKEASRNAAKIALGHLLHGEYKC